MRAVVTVMGSDKPGIIAGTSTLLANNKVNILDITQTIVRGIFTMVMLVDIENSKMELADLSESLKALGTELGVEIRIQHEDIFNSMHRI
ncbi:MAG: ACT domain-containing protein [Clostridia bacterium]|nr:ACT domain-containing protein [Clostridia bacterium]